MEWNRGPGHKPKLRRVAVIPFQDHRPRVGSNLKGLAWIPLVPFGRTVVEIPGHRLGFANPQVDVPRGLARELENARVFSSVEFRPKAKEGMDTSGLDLVLDGAIKSSRLEMKFFTYGISVAASPLWMLGAPMRRISYELVVYLRIVEAGTGKVLWDYEFDEQWVQWQGVYYGRNIYRYSRLTATGIRAAILDLDAAAAAGIFG